MNIKRILVSAALFFAPFLLSAQYSDAYNFGYNLGLEMMMTYTEVEDTVSVPSRQYNVYKFTLDCNSEVTIKMSSDIDVDYYLLNTENYALFKNGKSFSCYGGGATAQGIDEIYCKIVLTAGNYYYVINNKSKKSAGVQRLITVYPQLL